MVFLEKGQSMIRKILEWILGIVVLIFLVCSLANKETIKEQLGVIKPYLPGQYKVGVDLPAGEYVVVYSGDSYVELTDSPNGGIVVNDIFKNRSIVTVKDGEYIKFPKGKMYASSDAPKLEIKNETLPPGMYKVGKDLPAGEYKVISTEAGSCAEISINSTHAIEAILSTNLFTGSHYIRVVDGQYIKLFNCELKLK